MNSVIDELDTLFRAAIRSAWDLDADPLIAISGNEKFGDYQSNAAMGLAKLLAEKTGQKTNPRAIAEKITANLHLGDLASAPPTIAGPGFINIRLNPQWLQKRLGQLAADANLGLHRAQHPQRVVVDYSGPNIAKEMHVGHLRSTIIGDAISRAIESQGHQVIRQNHIGDWGTQFGMLIAYLNMPNRESPVDYSVTVGGGAQSDQIVIRDLEDFYRKAKQKFDEDPVFADTARACVVRLQSGDESARNYWRGIVAGTRSHYEPLYDRLGVKLRQEHERGESFYNPFLADVVKELKDKRIAEESQGAIVVPVEGFEAPLIIEKTGGGYLYATTDLAAIRFRIQELKANRIIYTHDSRQAQHFAQVFATAKKAGWAEGVSLEYAPFGTMLGEDGKPFKTRSGGTVKLKELLDEAQQRALEVLERERPELPEDQKKSIAPMVGIGAVKYADLSKDRTSDYVFSWDQMLNFKGNSAPYLQYVYARIRSIFRKASLEFGRGSTSPTPPIILEAPAEIALAKQILRLNEVIDLVARELKPHHLAGYLYELAIRFSGFYENCPVLQSQEPTRSSRLALAELTARTMATGLDLLGIAQPEQM
ncbi:MAG TPA: arginine--tRNA ligase [Tepidisphaeraceae bacterium]|nr:arginine--tRNA ligase [Tepidisphaeraceae bacterium]